MKVFTIGVNNKSAEQFFTLLSDNKILKIIDIRLNNTTQLCGFSKMNDLKFFLKRILNIEYEYISDFAPTKDIMVNYRTNKEWDKFKIDYLELLENRKIKKNIEIMILKIPVFYAVKMKQMAVIEKYFLNI